MILLLQFFDDFKYAYYLFLYSENLFSSVTYTILHYFGYSLKLYGLNWYFEVLNRQKKQFVIVYDVRLVIFSSCFCWLLNWIIYGCRLSGSSLIIQLIFNNISNIYINMYLFLRLVLTKAA